MIRDVSTSLDMTEANKKRVAQSSLRCITWRRDGAATYQMASAVVSRVVLRLSIFFLGEVRESGDGPKESRRHVHARRGFTWDSKLSASPGTVGECQFGTGTRDGETRIVAAGYRDRQSRCGLRLAGLVDSLSADKRILFARW